MFEDRTKRTELSSLGEFGLIDLLSKGIKPSHKSTVYGIFYGGIAIFNSIGTVIIGIIWKNYGVDKALIYSFVGLVLIIFFYKKCIK